MSDIDETALLPCPFCGGPAGESIGENADGSDFHYIECDDCASMAEPEVWNRRASGMDGRTLSEEEREALRAAISTFEQQIVRYYPRGTAGEMHRTRWIGALSALAKGGAK